MIRICSFGIARNVIILIALAQPTARAEPAGPFSSRPFSTPSVLTLEAARSLALEGSPSLDALAERTTAATGRTEQAGRIPNPEVAIEVENFIGSGSFRGFNSAETTIGLSQLILTLGKRSKRREVAEHDEARIALVHHTAEVELLRLVDSSFFVLLAAQERLAIGEELVRLADDASESVARQVSGGRRSSRRGNPRSDQRRSCPSPALATAGPARDRSPETRASMGQHSGNVRPRGRKPEVDQRAPALVLVSR